MLFLRYHDLPVDLLPIDDTTAVDISSMTRAIVYSISGETEYVRHDQVTVTDWLRLLVHEQAIVRDSVDRAREPLSAITLPMGEY